MESERDKFDFAKMQLFQIGARIYLYEVEATKFDTKFKDTFIDTITEDLRVIQKKLELKIDEERKVNKIIQNSKNA